MSVGVLATIGGCFVLVILVLFLASKAGWVHIELFKGKLAAGTKGSGITIKDAVSRKGKISANDETGVGVKLQRVDADGDIQAGSKNSDPK